MARELSCFVIIPTNWNQKAEALVPDDRWGLSELPSSCSRPANALEMNFDDVYQSIIREAVDKVNQAVTDVHIYCTRGQDITESGDIRKQVVEHICRADLTITDITCNNPNVFLEYAIRLSAKDSGNLLICHKSVEGKIPFDIGHLRAIPYSTELKGAADARNLIGKVLLSYVNGQKSADRSLYYEYVTLYTGRLLDKRLAAVARDAPDLIKLLAEVVFANPEVAKEYKEQVFNYLMTYKEAIAVDPQVHDQVIEHLKLMSQIRGLGQSRVRQILYELARICNADPRRKEEGAHYKEQAMKMED